MEGNKGIDQGVLEPWAVGTPRTEGVGRCGSQTPGSLQGGPSIW